ncbi:COX15/CtaA family protein [Congregibacter brevis]|uniref:COX15/CtaA family protein n=1 Tax=Congregibacter brevis TaxID=3081201 RepID=A0ABZ0IHY3_9GAMM|nr:COX15/CtaA family protein [Congregibacter sp. IMCC45268]
MFSRAYQTHHDRQLALWLLACAVVIYGMILLGGVTRLTESGLSMVEWRPIMGIWPPIGEAAWLEVFAKYQQFPEYQKINQGMDLAEFKVIFMYEYLHRVLGRIIGLLFVLPLAFFALRGVIRPGLMPRLLVLLVLGGCQGLLGWYMVKSGLVDRPSVSQYRLTAHLGLAVALYAAIVWQFLNLWPKANSASTRGALPSMQSAARWSPLLVVLVYLMILSGGLVAGTDAGYSYPTWPNMGPGFVPPGLYAGTPAWLAAFEDVTTIQFNHRMFAYVLLLLVGGFGLRLVLQSADGFMRGAGVAVIAALLLQITLGVSTLLTRMAIPVAAGHQAGAIFLLTVLLFTVHALRRRTIVTDN